MIIFLITESILVGFELLKNDVLCVCIHVSLFFLFPQVKTYNSPNIGVVAFLNYLMCDMHNDHNDDDIPHVKKCTGKILSERPKRKKNK